MERRCFGRRATRGKDAFRFSRPGPPERLCYLSSGDSGITSLFDDGPGEVVQVGEKLSHAGDDGDFEGLAPGSQLLIVSTDDGIASGGGEGGHVKDGAEVGSAAADVALATVGSRVVVHGSDSHEGCGGEAADAAQFGHACDEGGAGARAHASGGFELVGDGLGKVVAFDELTYLFVEVVDLLVQMLDVGLETGGDQRRAGMLDAAHLGGALSDELASPIDQVSADLPCFVDGIECANLDIVSVAGDDGGIEPVGLGEDVVGLGEIADGTRVDDGDGEGGAGSARGGPRDREQGKETIESRLIKRGTVSVSIADWRAPVLSAQEVHVQ